MPDIQFDEFELSYEAYLTGFYSAVPAGLTPARYYDYMIARLRQDPVIFAHTGFGFVLERAFYEQNRPEFKVYPGIMDALENTRVNVDARHFKLPFSAFMVRFPKNHIREDENSPYVRALLATSVTEPYVPQSRQASVGGVPVYVAEPTDPIVEKLVLYVCFAEPRGRGETSAVPYCFNFFKFPLLPGQTIEETFAATKMRSDGKTVQEQAEFDERGYWPSRVLYERLLKIAVGVAFFGSGRDKQKRNQVVEEERVPRRERRQIARGTGQRTRDVTRPIFVVGKDIQLPRLEAESREHAETSPESVCVTCGDTFAMHTKLRRGCAAPECQCLAYDSGRHISYGYIRCGHYHLYPVPGRHRSEYEARWIRPTPIRPDLPFGPPKARALQPPTGEIVSIPEERME